MSDPAANSSSNKLDAILGFALATIVLMKFMVAMENKRTSNAKEANPVTATTASDSSLPFVPSRVRTCSTPNLPTLALSATQLTKSDLNKDNKKAAAKASPSEQEETRTAMVLAPNAHSLNDSMTGRLLDSVSISRIHLHDIASLREKFPSANVINETGRRLRPDDQAHHTSKSILAYNKIVGQEDFIVADIVCKRTGNQSTEAFIRAGPRSLTHFDPTRVRAAIVTCGGLCPGLNNVVRELVRALYGLYGAEAVIGITGGFNGFSGKPGYDPIHLTEASVADCHHQGGSILGSSRGGFDIDIIFNFLTLHQISQLYVIGGDGTHRGANIISEECIKRNLNVAVVGIPKTIDNDVDIIDRSFGFTTSVEAAQASIISAKTEARCNLPNGIGIVKLMGRSAGFIAAHAALASGDVDLCLVPEVEIRLEGPTGILPYIMNVVKEKGHAVIVVAEGAGEELLGKSVAKDAGGNRKLPPIGEFLKTKVTDYFKANGDEATIKYIDPSYMIRSVAANASDSLYCMLLSQNAVHGAMAGSTGFSVGLVNNRVVYIPIPRLVATSPRVMDPLGRTWERVLTSTGQPQQAPSFDSSVCTVNDRTMV